MSRIEPSEAVKNWLENYSGNFDFYLSVKKQLADKGGLTVKQIQAIDRAIARDAGRAPRAAATPRTFSLKSGDRIEIKPWIANKLKEEFGFEVFLRNLEIVECVGESDKAYKVSVRFISEVVASCHVCGRALDTAVSRATGIGPVCADRMGLPRPTLENAQDILRGIEDFARMVGVIEPLWIPKSQVKNITRGRALPDLETVNGTVVAVETTEADQAIDELKMSFTQLLEAV